MDGDIGNGSRHSKGYFNAIDNLVFGHGAYSNSNSLRLSSRSSGSSGCNWLDKFGRRVHGKSVG
jgi:hypothetical protein